MKFTVGIPAFNERENILYLLEDLLNQQGDFELEEIIVISDGSNDGTAALARSFRKPFIKVVEDKKRLGKAVRLNQIFAQAKGDYTLLLDADVKLSSVWVLNEMAKVINSTRAELVLGNHKALKPVNYVQKLAYFGVDVWFAAVAMVDKDKERYRETGHIMALSRKLYSRLRFPMHRYANDDMFTYYFAKLNDFKIAYASKATVYYRLPVTFRDYLRQMRRMLKHRGIMSGFFGRDAVKKLETMSTKAKYSALLRKFKEYPLYISIGYVILQAVAKIMAVFHKPTVQWKMAESTKKI
jgi:glycosyltransferase involved in cell wall biosynthesis